MQPLIPGIVEHKRNDLFLINSKFVNRYHLNIFNRVAKLIYNVRSRDKNQHFIRSWFRYLIHVNCNSQSLCLKSVILNPPKNCFLLVIFFGDCLQIGKSNSVGTCLQRKGFNKVDNNPIQLLIFRPHQEATVFTHRF